MSSFLMMSAEEKKKYLDKKGNDFNEANWSMSPETFNRHVADEQTKFLDDEFKKSGLGQEYYDRFISNPYISSYFASKAEAESGGLLTDLQRGFTGSSQLDVNLRQAEAAMRAEWQGLIQEQAQNLYNSDVSKVGRMNQAGLNPNLLGTNDVAEDVGDPERGYGLDISSPIGDAAALDSVSSPILSVLNTFAQLKHLRKQNKLLDEQSTGKGLGNASDVADFAQTLARLAITPESYKLYQDNPDEFYKLNSVSGYDFAYKHGVFDPRLVEVLNNVYNSTLRSLVLHSSSYDDIVGIKQNKYQEDYLDALFDEDAPKALAQNISAKAKIELKYSQLQMEVMAAQDFEDLWKSRLPAEIKADVAHYLLSSTEDDMQRSVYEDFIDNGGVSQMSKEMLYSLKRSISDSIRQIKQNKLDNLDNQAMIDFLSGAKPSDAQTNKEARRRKRFARRASKSRYGESGYYRHWHNTLLGNSVEAGTSWLKRKKK